MSEAFKIKPGKYDIPSIGKVDANEEVTDDKAFAIYKLPRRVFPWIDLGDNAEDYLKKQKLVAKDVAQMVQNARTKEEAERLAALSETKTVNGILETKLKSLENTQD